MNKILDEWENKWFVNELRFISVLLLLKMYLVYFSLIWLSIPLTSSFSGFHIIIIIIYRSLIVEEQDEVF